MLRLLRPPLPFRHFLASCLLFVQVLDASAQVVLGGLQSSEVGTGLQGRVLLEELNCVACHDSSALADSSRPAPRLAQVGSRVHPDYLREFIEAPHQKKPGTPMPDLLADLEPGEKEEVAEAITHYLVSLNHGADFAQQAPDAVAAEQGRDLFHSVGCVACHSPRAAEGEELLPETSVPLGPLHEKYSHASLSAFLQRPHSVRPGGRMPDLPLSGQEIDRITNYLLRETRVPGHLAYTMWRGNVWEGFEGDVRKEKAGQVEDFSLEQFGNVGHQTALQYAGFLRVEQAGTYTFHLELNGGTLAIDGKEVAGIEPSNRRSPKKLTGSVELDAGWHPITLSYFHTGRDPRFSLEMEGPGFPRGPIPSTLLATSDRPIPVVEPLEVDPALAAQGKIHFESLGCAECHGDLRTSARREYPSLADLNPAAGCLTNAPGTPRFALDDEQRKLISSALPTVEEQTLSSKDRVAKTLVTFNCIACHEREGVGSIAPERDIYFTGTREALGNQGRIPPPLTHVGAKLTESWLEEVMLRGGRQREYLDTRMPVYREEEAGHLVELFGKVDELENVSFPVISNIRESKNAGYEMMGTEGFSCIACHDFNGQESGGAGALDLVHATDRLQKNWFHLYMRQPSRFHPAVIMPSYWPGGQSVRPDVLDGKVDEQIEALWNYLADGPRAKKPEGLSRQSPELRVGAETMMCRGRGTAGYRGIGVGYPERINLAFDSEEMALRLLWKGDFARVNNGSFRAIGSDRISFPPGIPFHRLRSLDDSWPYKGKTDYLFPHDHGYQYRGYFLNSAKQPTFMYQYGAIEVEDFFDDVLDANGNAFFKRTMTLTAPEAQEPFYFRVASGETITKTDDGWQIGKLTMTIPSGRNALVREGDPEELLIPLTLPKGETTLELDYQW